MKLVIVFLYCLLCFALMLQASPVDAEVTAASATGSISGKVTDAAGAGIQYVTVFVQD
jgi:hypothetical protein